MEIKQLAISDEELEKLKQERNVLFNELKNDKENIVKNFEKYKRTSIPNDKEILPRSFLMVLRLSI